MKSMWLKLKWTKRGLSRAIYYSQRVRDSARFPRAANPRPRGVPLSFIHTLVLHASQGGGDRCASTLGPSKRRYRAGSRAVIPVSRNSGTRSAVRLGSRIIIMLPLSARRTVARFVAKAEETYTHIAHKVIFLFPLFLFPPPSSSRAASLPRHTSASCTLNYAPYSIDRKLRRGDASPY